MGSMGIRPRLGADAIWWSFPLGSMVSLALAFGYYRFGNWRGSRILPAAPHPAEAVGQAPDTSMGTPCEDAGEVIEARGNATPAAEAAR